MIRWSPRLVEIWNRVFNGWSQIRSRRTLMMELIALSLVSTFIFFGEYWVQFHALAIDIDLKKLILFGTVSALGMFVSITPNGLGIRESIHILFRDVFGVSTDQILQASVLERGVLVLVLGLLFLLLHRNALFKKINSFRKA